MGPNALNMISSPEYTYPPSAIPTKIELVPKAMFRALEISETIALAIGITPSRRPWINRITTQAT